MKFLYPVPPASIVTQTFEEHVRRAQANGWQYYNGGIDWAIPTGTSIKAAQDGTIKETRKDATGYGTHVRIEHANNYTTIYAHMQKFDVKVGDKVKAGQAIGKSDNTGNSTGPHLHFELRKGTTPVDPAPLLVTKLDGTSGQEEPIDVTGDMGTEPVQFPKLPKVRVTAALLNVRTGAGVEYPAVTTLPAGTEVEVLRKVVKGNDIWLQIGREQFIAIKYQGYILGRWI